VKRMGEDAIYTPQSVARALIDRLPQDLRGNVIDPAAGDGSLLRAAQERFSDTIQPIGIDVDVRAVAALRREQSWLVGQADSLNPRSRNASAAWRIARSSSSAVVMNPPFSTRGGAGALVSRGSFHGRVGPSVEFVDLVLRELQPKLGAWCILPEGALEAERHAEFWAAVRSEYSVETADRLSDSTFSGARVSSVIVVIRPRALSTDPSGTVLSPIRPKRLPHCSCVEVIRGRVPVHRLQELRNGAQQSVPFVHSTNLNWIRDAKRLEAPLHLATTGPLILISRVGAWREPVLMDIGKSVLSDCVIGLRPRDRSVLPTLFSYVRSNQSTIKDLYKGTGAKYVTLGRLSSKLQADGWLPTVVPAGLSSQDCACG
jgi:hypothetical protein